MYHNVHPKIIPENINGYQLAVRRLMKTPNLTHSLHWEIVSILHQAKSTKILRNSWRFGIQTNHPSQTHRDKSHLYTIQKRP